MFLSKIKAFPRSIYTKESASRLTYNGTFPSLAFVATVGLLFQLIGKPAFGQEVEILETLNVVPLAEDREECLSNLDNFNWFCEQFDSPLWVQNSHYPFWERASLAGVRSDIDDDGTEDLIVVIGHSGYCGTAGCKNMFLFGDLPAQALPYSYGINSPDQVLYLVEIEGSRHLRFGLREHTFPISEIRQRTLSSRQYNLGE